MNVELSAPLQHALDSSDTGSVRILDPRTNISYVLVRADDYERVREILDDERIQHAMRTAALRNAVGRMNEEP